MIQENLHKIRETISEVATHCNRNPEDIRLVAVSKRFPVEVMREAIAAGQMIFGENYIQEAVQKKNLLGEVVKLHFIGNLQSNKAKFAVDTCSMVETVDRLKIAKAMNRYLEETEHSLDVLIQVNIGFDQNKSGVSPDESETLLKKIRDLPRLRVRGLMTMPPLMDDDSAQVTLLRPPLTAEMTPCAALALPPLSFVMYVRCVLCKTTAWASFLSERV